MPREKVTVVEVGLRDGLQMLPQVMPTENKIAWLDAERASGVRHFEAASFVPPKLLPQMADAASVVRQRQATFRPDRVGAGAEPEGRARRDRSRRRHAGRPGVRQRSPQPRQRAADAGRDGGGGRPHLRGARCGQPQVRVYAGVATAFGCTIQGEVPEERVVRIAAGCVEAGADEIGLADTVGYANPAQVRRLFERVRKPPSATGVSSAHFHDTRGTGLANVVAALEAGIRSFDASLGGLGGCPYAPGASGNIATEDLVFMLEAMGLDTGIRLDALHRGAAHAVGTAARPDLLRKGRRRRCAENLHALR